MYHFYLKELNKIMHVFNNAYKQNQGKTLIYINLLCSKYDHKHVATTTLLQLFHILQIKLIK